MTSFSRYHLLLALPLGMATGPAAWADELADGSTVALQSQPLSLAAELELQAGLWRMPYDGMALPVGGAILLDTYTPHRDAGGMVNFGLQGDVLGLEGETTLLGLEVYQHDLWQGLDVRAGRLNLMHGGRFSYVDGINARIPIGQSLALNSYVGSAWHPEQRSLGSGGSTWGLDMSYRGISPLGGGVRYDHIVSEADGWVERLGGDVGLHLPSLDGLAVEGRVDYISSSGVLEQATLAGEVRPHHRVHLRVETGRLNPTADVFGQGGIIYPLFVAGPTLYAESRLRVSLPPGVLLVDAEGLGITTEEGVVEPGFRASVGGASHPGSALRQSFNLSALTGPGGTATMGLVEVGRTVGPANVAVIAEHAFYKFEERLWRAVSQLGTRIAIDPSDVATLSLTGQLTVGRTETLDGQVLVLYTYRMRSGQVRNPSPVRDRYLSPWSPYPWKREEMPRSPGTVPGADPYPSVPMGMEVANGE